MTNFQYEPLPTGLQQLEQSLAQGVGPGPPEALRDRVMSDVRTELRRERSRRNWAFAAVVAASVALWMNLSLSATQATDYGLRAGGYTVGGDVGSRQIDLLREFLSEGE